MIIYKVIVMGKLMISKKKKKKNQEKSIVVPNVIKYLNTVLHSQDTTSLTTSLIDFKY